MNLLLALAERLRLEASSGDEQVLAAVDGLLADQAEVWVLRQDLATARAELAAAGGRSLALEEDAFISDAVRSGRIGAGGDVDVWRDAFRQAPDRARTLMAKRPEGLATPVGLPRQSATVPAEPRARGAGGAGLAPSLDDPGRSYVEQHGVDYDESARLAAAFGATNPKKAIAKFVAGVDDDDDE